MAAEMVGGKCCHQLDRHEVTMTLVKLTFDESLELFVGTIVDEMAGLVDTGVGIGEIFVFV